MARFTTVTVGAFDVDSAFQAFIFDRSAMGRSPRTIETLRFGFGKFRQWLDLAKQPTTMNEWGPELVLDWYTYMREQTRPDGSPRWTQVTQATWSRAVHAFLAYCEGRQWIAWKTPSAIQEPRGERDVLSKPQMQRLGEVSGKSRNGIRNRALILTLLATGLRLGEISQLEVGDVDWQNGLMRVRPETSKVRRFRYVPLGQAARQALYEYLSFSRGDSRQPRLFLNEYGLPLEPRGIQMLVRRLGKKIGVERLHPHMLRHTYATQSLLSGVPLPPIQLMMGHSDINTTSIYLNQVAIQESAKHHQWTPADGL